MAARAGAGAVAAASRRGLFGTFVVGVGAAGDRGADADQTGEVALLAESAAGLIAAHAVDAVVAGALRWALAGLAACDLAEAAYARIALGALRIRGARGEAAVGAIA